MTSDIKRDIKIHPQNTRNGIFTYFELNNGDFLEIGNERWAYIYDRQALKSAMLSGADVEAARCQYGRMRSDALRDITLDLTGCHAVKGEMIPVTAFCIENAAIKLGLFNERLSA